MRFVPCFSHGGQTDGQWPSVTGNTTNSGRPIDIGGASPEPANWPVLIILCTGGTATVLIEANGGELDSTSTPPTAEWIDISDGGYALTAGTNVAKRIPPNVPYIRTRITAISGATVVSYVPAVCFPNQIWGSAKHPSKSSTGVA